MQIENVDWQLTSHCNRMCPYCYGPANFNDLSLSEVKSIVDTLAKMGVKQIGLTGGEPLLYPHITDLIEYIFDNDIKIYLSSNCDYPEGRVAVQVSPAKDCFVATARIYPSYKDPVDCFLAEATASRGPCADKPSVSPREWAQTAAVGIALRNAGFGLQFAMAGEDFESAAVDELGLTGSAGADAKPAETQNSSSAAVAPEEYTAMEMPKRELTPEEKMAQAMQVSCPITKFGGKTLGEVLTLDPGAIKWVATKFTGNEEVKAAAQFICDYAMQASA